MTETQALTIHRNGIVAAYRDARTDDARRSFMAWAKEITAGAVRERYNAESEVVGLEVTPGRRLSLETAEKLLASVDWLLRPVAPSVILEAVAKCLGATVSKDRAEIDVKTLAGVFAEDLAGYPEDVVVSAFRTYRLKNRFWPTVAEIVELCEIGVRWRRSARRLAEVALAEAMPAVEDSRPQRYSDLSPEQKADLAAKLERVHADIAAAGPKPLVPPAVKMPQPETEESESWPVE